MRPAEHRLRLLHCLLHPLYLPLFHPFFPRARPERRAVRGPTRREGPGVRGRSPRRHAPALLPRAFRLLVLPVAVAVAAPTLAATPENDLARTAAETARLRVLADLAAGEPYALALDVPSRTLRLMLRGALLEEFPVTAIEVGTRRVAFFGAAEADPRGAIREGGDLVPPRPEHRVEIVPPEPGETPPSNELLQEMPAIPVPGRFRIRFDDGFALEIVQNGGSGWGGLRARLADAIEGEPVRLRLTLSAEDAARIYRSLPPDVRFAVLD